MKRFRPLVLVIAVLLLAGLAYYFYAGGAVPNGQHPLVALTAENFPGLQQEFNGAQGATRLFILMSPT